MQESYFPSTWPVQSWDSSLTISPRLLRATSRPYLWYACHSATSMGPGSVPGTTCQSQQSSSGWKTFYDEVDVRHIANEQWRKDWWLSGICDLSIQVKVGGCLVGGSMLTHWKFLHIFNYRLCRFVLIKYVDRGLVNDRYYYNMNMTLFKTLFWIINISVFFINQGNILAFSIKHGGTSLYSNTYRLFFVSD